MIMLPEGAHCASMCWRCIQCTTLCFRKCFLFFRNEHAQSTPLGVKLMSLVVLRDSVVAKAGVWVHTMHHFVLSKMFLVLSLRTCPIHSFRPKTHVMGGFARLQCRKVPLAKARVWGAHNARICAFESVSCSFATNMPNPLL